MMDYIISEWGEKISFSSFFFFFFNLKKIVIQHKKCLPPKKKKKKLYKEDLSYKVLFRVLDPLFYN